MKSELDDDPPSNSQGKRNSTIRDTMEEADNAISLYIPH